MRKNYNSLLITHILDGSFTYIKDGKHITAHKGDTVILDCYKPHEYYTNDSLSQFGFILPVQIPTSCLKKLREAMAISLNARMFSI